MENKIKRRKMMGWLLWILLLIDMKVGAGVAVTRIEGNEGG